VTAFVAAGVALAVYLATMAPGLTEIDAGELAGVAATLGVAHPSGYPLYSVVGRAWNLLPWPMRTILAMNVLSAVLAAGAVFLVHRTIRDVLPEPAAGKGRVARELGAWTGSLAFAMNGTMWSVATVTEVHALQMFLDAAFLHAIVRSGLWGGRRFRESAFLAACYLGGLCLTNHLTSALLWPGFGLALWLRRREVAGRTLAAGLGLAALGVSVYAFLPIRSAQFPVFDWGGVRTLEAFWRHVSGAQYRVWMFASGEAFLRNLREFLGLLPAGFGWPLLGFAVAGLWRARRIRGLLAGSLAMSVLAVLYPLGYDIHDIETYFLPPFLFVAIWIGLGFVQLVEWGEKRGGAASRLVPALFALPLLPAAQGWRAADRSDDRWVEAMAHSFLETPRQRAVVLTAHWDVLQSPALYLQEVEGIRPDLTLLDQEHFRRSWNLPWIERHHPDLLEGLGNEAADLQRLLHRFERDEPYDAARIQAKFEAVINGILANGSARGGAYITPEIEAGIGADRVRVPDGLLFRLDDPDAKVALGPPAPWPELPPGPDPPEDTHFSNALGYAARMAAYAGLTAFRLGQTERARDELARALAWNPREPLAREGWEALGRAGGP
jgi:hypothetical protein